MRDFTISRYIALLQILQKQNFSFQPFSEFIENPKEKAVMLRHDVDLLPYNSLKTAQIENELGIRGSYYFRIVPESYNETIIKQIADLGHEIGYHYETMDTVSSKFKVQGLKFKEEHNLIDAAYEEFCRNLEMFREIVSVETICMHGSPRSKYDNKMIWDKYDYKTLGIIGEPYFDIDFSKVGYLTDTGRRWNGDKVSIRDKVNSPFNFNFRSTQDIINSVGKLPDQVMFTFHPQRWNDNWYPWIKELALQNIKNQVKRLIVIASPTKEDAAIPSCKGLLRYTRNDG